MPSNVVIELAERNGTSYNNGDWENIVFEQTEVNEGDVVNISQCFINTLNPSTNNIVVDEDTSLQLSIGYYDCCPIAGMGSNGNGVLPPNRDSNGTSIGGVTINRRVQFAPNDDNSILGQYSSVIDPLVNGGQSINALQSAAAGKAGNTYMAMTYNTSTNTFEQLTQDISIKLPKGVFNPDSLADLITEEIQSAPEIMISVTDCDKFHFNPSCPDGVPITKYQFTSYKKSGDNINIKGKMLDGTAFNGGLKGGMGADYSKIADNVMIHDSFGDKIPLSQTPNLTILGVSTTPSLNNIKIRPDAISESDNSNFQLNLPRAYNPELFAILTTDDANDVPLNAEATLNHQRVVFFCSPKTAKSIIEDNRIFTMARPQSADTYSLLKFNYLFQSGDQTLGALFTPYIFGGLTPSCVVAGNSYQFQNFHMPVLSSGAGDETSPAPPYATYGIISFRRNNLLHEFKKFSGIYLYDIFPVDKWQVLGYSPLRGQITATTDDPDFLIDKNTTEAFANLEYLIRKDFMTPTVEPEKGADGFDNFIEVSDDALSTSILPNTNIQSDEVGYYLIETVTTFSTRFKTTDAKHTSITAIASKQYNNADFVTVFSDSAIPYTHVGEPVSISSVRTRILDPRTMTVVKNLGNQNSIILQIQKNNILPNTNGSQATARKPQQKR